MRTDEAMTKQAHCSTCGRPIREDDLSGLCASCLLGLIMDGDDPHSVPGSRAESLLKIPGYEVCEEIARGGMGIVYRAVQLEPRRDVALKMLLPHQAASHEMLERFRLEARAIAALEHPAILPVHHVGEHNRLPFFTMKLAGGGTLAQRKTGFAGKWRDIAELVATLADAVQFAHERGVLHRDLKPGNVLFDEAGRAYVSDFGLAKLVGTDTDLTRSVEFLGTPHYIAPEVAARSAKEATTASDIYSLGAILYELLAGRPPFEAEGVPALLKKIVEDEPTRPSEFRSSRREEAQTSKPEIDQSLLTSAATRMPRDLEVICLKCLAKEPSQRYASARDLANDLRRWVEGRTIIARPATRLERVHSWARRNPAIAAMSALLVVVLVAAVIWQAHSNRQLQHALSESLLRQARLERSSGAMGQRFETLSLVSRAAEHLEKSWIGRSSVNLASLRTEAAAALALPDARSLARWPVHISHFENAFDFSADLARYITAAPGGGFTVFSTADHNVVFRFAGESNNPVTVLNLSPDGSWAAVRFQDRHAELHSLNGNQSPRRWPSNRGSAAVFAFAPSAKRFAVLAHTPGRPSAVEIIDLESGATVGNVPGGQVNLMAFDYSATHLAIAGAELTVFRLSDTNKLWTASLTRHAVGLGWSPDGRQIAVSLARESATGPPGETDPVLFFDAANGQQQSVFAEFGSVPARLEFSPDSRSLVAATWDDQLVWGSTRPKELRLAIPGAHRALRFSPDGRRLGYAPSKEELGLVELAAPDVWHEWQMTSAPASQCFAISVSADGRWVVTSAQDGLHLWDAKRREEVGFHPIPEKRWWTPVFFGPADTSVYYGASQFGVRRVELIRSNAPDGRTGIQFGSLQQVGAPRDYTVSSIASDGRSLVIAEHHRQSQNDRVPPIIWLWPDGEPVKARKLAENFQMVGYRQIPGRRWGITTDRIVPDAWIWNFETGERVRGLGIPVQVNSEPTANGRWVATRTREEIAVWEVGTWRRISRWPARPDERDSGDIIASKDSRLLGTDTSDGGFVLRELPSGAELVKLTPPRAVAVRHWGFAPDGARLIVLLKNGQVVEWHLAELRRELAKMGLDWQ